MGPALFGKVGSGETGASAPGRSRAAIQS